MSITRNVLSHASYGEERRRAMGDATLVLLDGKHRVALTKDVGPIRLVIQGMEAGK